MMKYVSLMKAKIYAGREVHIYLGSPLAIKNERNIIISKYVSNLKDNQISQTWGSMTYS